MRIDLKLTKKNYSKTQLFFLECWYNMVHQYSIDSYRLKTMNPVNSSRELYKIMTMPHASEADKKLVFLEAIEIICATKEILSEDCQRLVTHLTKFANEMTNAKKTPIPTSKFNLLVPLVNSLHLKLRDCYINDCKLFFETILYKEDLSIQELQSIKSVTSSFLSVLLDEGSSIESLFNLYKGILAQFKKENYPFSKRLGLMFKIVTSGEKSFTVVFALQGIGATIAKIFPNQIGEISFEGHIDQIFDIKEIRNKLFTTTMPTKKFAIINVQDRDPRHAGTVGYEEIYKTLDIIRFEFSSEPISISEEFVCLDKSQKLSSRLYTIPKVVPNPIDQSQGANNLNVLIQQVDKLIRAQHIPDKDRDRVISALRFYRYGSDTNIFENKLVNWWTAIEYLTSIDKPAGAISDRVVSAITPVLCLNYLEKHLSAIRKLLSDLNISFDNGDKLEKKSIFAFKTQFETHHQEIFDKLNDWPYVQFMVQQIHEELIDAKKLSVYILLHQKRIELQLQRIYRARCDIVHSAEVLVSPALLCANLEFYLKLTLTKVLETFVADSNLTSTRDFFKNSAFQYELMMNDLKQGKYEEFLHQLSVPYIGF